MKHDYDKMKQFSVTEADNGEPICNAAGFPLDFITGPDSAGQILVQSEGAFALLDPDHLRMRPLAWVEGSPVYKGSTLWYQGYVGSADQLTIRFVEVVDGGLSPSQLVVRDMPTPDNDTPLLLSDSTIGYSVNLSLLSWSSPISTVDIMQTSYLERFKAGWHKFWQDFFYDGNTIEPEYVCDLRNQILDLQQRLAAMTQRADDLAANLSELKFAKVAATGKPVTTDEHY